MKPYILLLRGVNVGGKNKLPMAGLKKCLEELGYTGVTTYIASGNVLVRSRKKPTAIQSEVESVLPKKFKLDSELVKVLVVPHTHLKAIVNKKPKGFGDEPHTYHSDVIFLMDISASSAMKVCSPKEGVDTLWPGKGVIYSQRLSAERTKSRLNRIMGTPAYKQMTIRNWNTTQKLLEMLESR